MPAQLLVNRKKRARKISLCPAHCFVILAKFYDVTRRATLSIFSQWLFHANTHFGAVPMKQSILSSWGLEPLLCAWALLHPDAGLSSGKKDFSVHAQCLLGSGDRFLYIQRLLNLMVCYCADFLTSCSLLFVRPCYYWLLFYFRDIILPVCFCWCLTGDLLCYAKLKTPQ